MMKTSEKKPQTTNKERKTFRPASGESLLGLDVACFFDLLQPNYISLILDFELWGKKDYYYAENGNRGWEIENERDCGVRVMGMARFPIVPIT